MTEEDPIISWVLNHQWRDITKELPPYEVPVLVHRDDGIYLEMRYDKNKVFNPCLDEYGFDIDDKGFNNEARYWMSIPSSDKIRYFQDAADRDVEDSFVEGAEWALEHQWIDVNKSLPEYEEDVMVTTDGKDCWFSHRSNNPDVMKESHDFAVCGWEEVKYWMPIPKLKVK